MEGRLEKSSSGVTCHRRKAKHCFLKYNLFIKLHFGLFLISNLLLLLHFPLVFYFSCEPQQYYSVCRTMENRALQYAGVEKAARLAVFCSGFGLAAAVPTNLGEKSTPVKVDKRCDNQL